MKQHSPGAWISLNTSYYIAPLGHPAKLLEYADLLLGGAHGITQSLSGLLSMDGEADPGDLADALWGAAMLIEMGQRNALEARRRMMEMWQPVDDDIGVDEVAES